MTTTANPARINSSKVVHAFYAGAFRTVCTSDLRSDSKITMVEGAEFTCKRCLKGLAN